VSDNQALIRQFGQTVRQARQERGMSQTQLGSAAGISVSEISRIERGTRGVRVTTLLRLIHALGAEPNELLAGVTLPVESES
jgi:transcriptional regulator with XRE-family HTH domain